MPCFIEQLTTDAYFYVFPGLKRKFHAILNNSYFARQQFTLLGLIVTPNNTPAGNSCFN